MFVEREEQCGALQQAIRSACRGCGSVALLLGEAGIGKTALINAALAELPSDVLLLRGGCDDLRARGPLGPIREALAAAGADDLERASYGQPHEFWLDLTRALAGDRPTILVVEDLQWADEASLDVLSYLARRVERMPVLIIGSYREAEVGSGHPLHRWLASIASHPMQLRLPPLTLAGVEALCEGSGWDPAALFDLSGGIPFYVLGALSASMDSPLTDTVAAAVAARLDVLPPRTRVLLERMSVWPGVLRHEQAEDLLGHGLSEILSAEACGFIVTDHDGMRFGNEMTRLAILAQAPRFRRRADAREAVELLKPRGEAELPRLIQLAVTGDDDSTVVELAHRAARIAADRGDTLAAIACYEAGLAQQRWLGQSELAALVYDYAGELQKTDRFDRAIDSARWAVDLCRELADPLGEARARVRLSQYLFLNGSPQAARDAAARALVLARGVDPPLVSEALAALGIALAQDRAASAMPVLDRARVLADLAGRGADRATCMNYQAQYDPQLTLSARIDLLNRSIEVARCDDAGAEVTRGQAALAELLLRFARYDELDRLLQVALPYAREHGCRSELLILQVCQAFLSLHRGQWASAEQTLRQIQQQGPAPSIVADFSSAAYGRLLARRGNPEAATTLRDCWERACAHRWLPALGQAATGLAEWGWLTGDTAQLVTILRAWEEHADRPGAESFDAELRRFGQLAGIDVPERPGAGALAATPWGPALAGRRREAAHRWQKLGDHYQAALELADSGDERAMLRAWQALDQMGAAEAARQVRRRLQAQGTRSIPRGPRPGTRNNPGGLTDRQLEVARLLAQALTNGEIAARLMVSERTVDHHVSSILAKLGLTTRRGVVTMSQTWEPTPSSYPAHVPALGE